VKKEVVAEIKEIEPVINRKKRSYKEQFEMEQIEKELPELQQKKSSLEQELSLLANDYDRIVAVSKELETTNHQIDAMEIRWLELCD
jgi:ATP-binding cassette subfamily F protein uup